ncbi:MAG: hypothetical protein ABIA47_01845 [bacterium]
MSKGFHFKRDEFKKSRGGWSRILELYCAKCDELVLFYQKDGRGSLKRLYLDRIMAPDRISRYGLICQIGDVPNLTCKKCGELLGTPIIFKKEKRKAFRLYQDSTTHKIVKSRDAGGKLQMTLEI